MLRIITIIISLLLLLAGMEEPWFAVLAMSMLWYVFSRTPQEKQETTTKQKIFRFFKWLLILFGLVILLVVSNFTYEGRFFLVFFFMNLWVMNMPNDKKKISWRISFSMLIFTLLILSSFNQLTYASAALLSVYWYGLYRYQYVAFISLKQKSSAKVWTTQLIIEFSYLFLMLFTLIFTLISRADGSSYYRNYFSIDRPVAAFFFFGLLLVLTFVDKKKSLSAKVETLPISSESTVKEPSIDENTAKETSVSSEVEASKEEHTKEEHTVEVKPEEEKEPIKVQPKPSLAAKYTPLVLSFLRQNIANVVLLFGVLFILTATITFLRSNWDAYKYIVFVCFAVITTSFFVSGYTLYPKKKLEKLSFLFLILATIFFPLVFYFAVKVGLLHDRGNKYIVIWLTTFIAMLHTALFRSAFFSIVAIAMFSWANWLTLVKIGIYQYEGFTPFYGLQSILFLCAAIYYKAKRASLYHILLVASNLSLFFTVILGVLFWQANIFVWVSFIGICFTSLQIRFVVYSWTHYYNGILVSSSIISFVALLCNLVNLSVFWMGIPVAITSFLCLHHQSLLPWKLESETRKAIKSISFATPLFVLAIYLLWGGYTSYNGTYALFMYTMICGIGYFVAVKELPHKAMIFIGALFSTLSVWEVAKIANIHPHNYTALFLVWATVLAYLASETRLKKSELIAKPLNTFSLFVVPISLVYLVIQGYEYYYDSFTSLIVSLIFISCFCVYMAQRLQRNDLFLTGVVTTISFATLLVHRVNPEFYFFAIVVIAIATAGLFLTRYARFFSEEAKQKYKLLFSPVVWTFAIAALFLSLGQNTWEIKIVYVLSSLFFLSAFYLFSHTIDLYFGLAHITIFYTLFFYNDVSIFDWGIYLLPFTALQILIAKKISQQDVAKHLFIFARVLFITCILLFVSFIQLQYQQNYWIYPLLLLLVSIAIEWYEAKTIHIISIFTFSYVSYFFILPKGWFVFQYALFYIPLAILALLYYYKNLNKVYSPLLVRFAHATVLFFILLPAVLPGMVPSAKVSMWVIALAFAFYFVGLYFTKKPIYSYISSLLFSACLLTALFATKILWGNEIALGMTIGSLLLLTIAFLWRKKSLQLTEPILHVVLFNTIVTLSSLLVIGRLYYSALITCTLSSIVIMVLIHISTSLKEQIKNTLVYLALFLFAATYYLLLEKIQIEPRYSMLLIVFLAFVYSAASFIFIKSKYSTIYLYCAILLPALALKHIGDTLNLSILLILCGAMYGYIAERKQSKPFAFLTTSTITLAAYSVLAYLSAGQSQVMIFALFISWHWFYFASRNQQKYSFAVPAMLQSAFINQAIFFTAYVYNSPQNLTYFTIIAAFINSGVLFLVYKKLGLASHKTKIILTSIFSFTFSYYITILSWSVSVWEFYTIPIGLLLITYAYIANHREKFAFFNDFVLAGLMLILLPTFVQSYHGWFDHLYHLGVSPYAHLKHSILLCLESMVLIFAGIMFKRFILFMVGCVFLFSDVALVLFAYVDFGTIPQSVWWASLGVTCITFWMLMEYKKEWLIHIKEKIKAATLKSKEHMKTWQ